jgi:hypothetical protein
VKLQRTQVIGALLLAAVLLTVLIVRYWKWQQ